MLTDARYFQGSFKFLADIRAAGVACPLLCKEFIVEAYQLFKARARARLRRLCSLGPPRVAHGALHPLAAAGASWPACRGAAPMLRTASEAPVRGAPDGGRVRAGARDGRRRRAADCGRAAQR